MNSEHDTLLNKLLHSTLDNLLEGCQILDFNWKYIYINDSADKHNQRPKEELLGKRYMDMWPGIENTEVFQKIKRCMETRIPQLMKNEFIFPDGTAGWFDLSIQPIPEGVFILSIDITEKKRAEQENLFKEERFRHVFETANVGKSITQISGEIEVNQAFCDILGYEKDELNNKHWKEITPPEDINITEEIVTSLLTGVANSARFTKRYLKKNGTTVWTDVNVALFRDDKNIPQYFITTIIDISKQKKAEMALLQSQHMLNLFVEHSPAAIAMFDKEMHYILVSHRYLTDYGLDGQDIIGKSHYEVLPEIPDHWKNIHKKCLSGATERSEEEAFARASGKIDWVRWEIHPWYENDGEIGGIILFSELVTQRKIAEKAIKKSEDLFNKAFHGSPSPMTIARQSDGTYIAVNDSFLKLVGITREEAIGRRGHEMDLIDTEQRSKIIKILREKGSLKNIEVKARTKSGREVFLLTSVENTELAGEPCTIATMQDITHRKIAEIQLKEKTEEIEAQNEEYQQLNEELFQINDELQEAKDRAEESDRLKTAFLHNISHEIRTPLNSIIGFTELLRKPELQPEKRQRYLEIIEQSSNQLLSIITDIINIAAIEAGQVKIFNSSVNTNSILNFLFEQFLPAADKKDIALSCYNSLSERESVITTDETKLVQIVTNLLNNALKFTERGHIKFGYSVKDSDLEFYVEDTGIGIPLDMQNKIFDRFHQVESIQKPQFGGSGLGLSISKGYVELLGGKIWIVSEEGKGSTFYFTIPYLNPTH